MLLSVLNDTVKFTVGMFTKIQCLSNSVHNFSKQQSLSGKMLLSVLNYTVKFIIGMFTKHSVSAIRFIISANSKAYPEKCAIGSELYSQIHHRYAHENTVFKQIRFRLSLNSRIPP